MFPYPVEFPLPCGVYNLQKPPCIRLTLDLKIYHWNDNKETAQSAVLIKPWPEKPNSPLNLLKNPKNVSFSYFIFNIFQLAKGQRMHSMWSLKKQKQHELTCSLFIADALGGFLRRIVTVSQSAIVIFRRISKIQIVQKAKRNAKLLPSLFSKGKQCVQKPLHRAERSEIFYLKSFVFEFKNLFKQFEYILSNFYKL